MKRWFVGAMLLVGCVTPSTLMVDDKGRAVRCSSAGYGLIGASLATSAHDDCVADMKRLGYRELPGKNSKPKAAPLQACATEADCEVGICLEGACRR